MKREHTDMKEKFLSFFKDHRKTVIWISSVTLVVLLAVIGCAVYLNDYYPADHEAISEYAAALAPCVSYTVEDDGLIIASPNEAAAGFIFYPGGKVEYDAYLPLMLELAERGILSVLVPMPCNLAVLDMNAADGIAERFPDVEIWYIGGHSLGGSMAASYLAKNKDRLRGAVLLGSYSTADISDSRVISIYGSADGVMNSEKYEKYKANLPGDLTEIVIEGGNHAGFGMYGEQDGDGASSIGSAEQISATAEYIAEFILRI